MAGFCRHASGLAQHPGDLYPVVLVEEVYLNKVFGEAFLAYRNRGAFLITDVVTRRRWLGISISIGIPRIMWCALTTGFFLSGWGYMG